MNDHTDDAAESPESVYKSDLMGAMRAFPERVARSFMEQRELIDAIFDSSRQFVLLVNAAGEIARASRFLSSALGFDEDELRGTDWRRALVAGDWRARADEFMASARESGAGQVRLAVATRLGTSLGLDLVARALGDLSAPYAFLISGTLRGEVDEAGPHGAPVDEASGRVLRSMGEAALAVEPDSGLVVDCNREAAALFGSPAEDMLGRPAGDFLSGESRGTDPRADSALMTGFLNEERSLRRTSGGAFHASVLALPIIGPLGSLDRVLFVIRDLSAAREAERERRGAATRLRELALSLAELGARLGADDAGEPAPSWSLTPRQKEIAGCVVAGMPNKQIAHALGLSESSVKVHVYSMYKKTGARSRVEFVRLMQDAGFLSG